MTRYLDHAMWLLMEHDIYRYLICNTKGWLDGWGKANHHREICQIIMSVYTGGDPESLFRAQENIMNKIHKATQLLTNDLS